MPSDASHVIAYEKQLAASGLLHETTRISALDGAVEEVTQYVLAMRTATPMIEALKAHVMMRQRDDLLEFVVVPIVAANEKYLGWIDDYVDERRTLQPSGGRHVL
ncbi:MAG: divalent cation tolerance protein CutA [Chloroflexi bacterium]|nr:divalent cation tolerance protein CutA [Chloroflexota bacterium]